LLGRAREKLIDQKSATGFESRHASRALAIRREATERVTFTAEAGRPAAPFMVREAMLANDRAR
jgi:hypothetical protein